MPLYIDNFNNIPCTSSGKIINKFVPYCTGCYNYKDRLKKATSMNNPYIIPDTVSLVKLKHKLHKRKLRPYASNMHESSKKIIM